MFGFGVPELVPTLQAPRVHKSKWDQSPNRTIMPNVACILPPDLSPDILHAFLCRFQFEEVQYKIANIEEEFQNVLFGEPAMSKLSDSKLVISPDVRARDNLVSERRTIIESIEKIFPAFRAPFSVMLSLQKSVKKLELTAKDDCMVILGPQARTLRALEKDYNVKISIRGPDSQTEEEGKQNNFGHVMVIGNNDDDVTRCINKISSMLQAGDFDQEEKVVDVDSYSLSFNPFEDTVPWEVIDTANTNEQRFGTAISELIKDIDNNDNAGDNDETPARKAIFERFSIDLSRKDVSCLLREANPPGLG